MERGRAGGGGEWTASGDMQDAAPVSRRAGGSSPGVEPSQVEEELREDRPTLRGGEEGLQGSAQGRAGQDGDPFLPVLCVYLRAACLVPWKRDLLECFSAADSSCSFFSLRCPRVLKILTSFGLLCCGEKVCPILPKC